MTAEPEAPSLTRARDSICKSLARSSGLFGAQVNGRELHYCPWAERLWMPLGWHFSPSEGASFFSGQLDSSFYHPLEPGHQERGPQRMEMPSQNSRREMDVGSLQGLTGLKIWAVCVVSTSVLLWKELASHSCLPPFLGGWGVPVVMFIRIKWTKFPVTWSCRPESRATRWARTPHPHLPQGKLPLPGSRFSSEPFPRVYQSLPAGAGQPSALAAHFSPSKTATLENNWSEHCPRVGGASSGAPPPPTPPPSHSTPHPHASAAFLQDVQSTSQMIS